eukprot:g4171.t1
MVTWKWIPIVLMITAVSHMLVELSRQERNNITVETKLEEIYFNMALDLFASSTDECLEISQKYPESYSAHSKKRTINLEGPVYATYIWTQPITKDLIDIQRNRSGNSSIPGNTRVLFKVKDSVLYVDASDTMFNTVYPKGLEATVESPYKLRCDALIELLLVTLHLYNVPDLDFVVELSDGVHPTEPRHPVLSYSISLKNVHAGFTIPSFGAFSHSLGETQSLLLKECLKVQHPRDKRIRQAVWRGTTTGQQMFSADDVLQNHRVKLCRNCARRPDLFDVGIVDYIQIDENDTKLVEKLTAVAPKKERIPMSEFNDYAVVLDVDGNGWSDRLPILLNGDSLVLKQNYDKSLDYLSESLKQSEAIEFFKWDLSDLESQASMLLHEYTEEREIWEARIERMADFAKEYVSQDGVIRAMAYALTNYAKFQNWEVEMQDGYVLVPKTKCCKISSALPRGLIDEVQSS